MKSRSSYTEMRTVFHVHKKVPKAQGKHMNPVAKHEFTLPDGTKAQVPDHWRHGQMVDGIIINQHFYGINDDDLGNFIMATVKVVQKKTREGTYIMLDITKETDCTRAEWRVKFLEQQQGENDILIPGTRGHCLHFEPLTPKESVNEARQQEARAQ
jgi:hypothetical protein